MTLKGILNFKFIYSNEIYSSSNKNHYQFLQCNEEINGIFILLLVIFSLKTLLQQGISEPEFYGDLVYRFRKIVGKSNFSEQFRKLINRYKSIGYRLDIMRQTACLVVNPIIVDGYASLFNCTTAVRASDSMTTLTSGLGLDNMSLAWPAVVQLLVFIYYGIQ